MMNYHDLSDLKPHPCIFPYRCGGQCHWDKVKLSAKLVLPEDSREEADLHRLWLLSLLAVPGLWPHHSSVCFHSLLTFYLSDLLLPLLL